MKLCRSSAQVDTLEFYADRLRELLSQIAAEKEAALPPNESAMPSAFTTFRERRDQACDQHLPIPSSMRFVSLATFYEKQNVTRPAGESSRCSHKMVFHMQRTVGQICISEDLCASYCMYSFNSHTFVCRAGHC